MALTAHDVKQRLTELAAQRTDIERVWRQVASVAATDGPEFLPGQSAASSAGSWTIPNQALASRRSKNLYDGTASWAVDRLASGLEGLIMPSNETWHSLAPLDLFSMNNEPTDEEVEWLEKLRNFQFRVRYDAASGWQTALQVALRRLVAFGTGLMFVEEGDGRTLIRYRHLPINESYLTEDHYGRADGLWRPYKMTARQIVQKFGNKTPLKIQAAAESMADADRYFSLIHVIAPRGDFGSPSEGAAKAPWASMHFDLENDQLIAESGFYEFPVIDFRWLPEPGKVYGESPIMRVLSDIQSLNLMAKNEMIASQQSIDPPLLVARQGLVNRPDANPGKLIVGGIDEMGRERVKPLQQNQRIDFAQAVIQAKRDNLRESLYINLFATMVQTPRMSATEAMIRAGEKGELLGPAGTRIQESLSRLVERELGILSRFGLLDQDSVFRAPKSMQGREIGPKFTNQLDRLRRSKEAEGTLRWFEIFSPLAQMDPTVFDILDKDETARGLADVLGMPRKFMMRVEEVDAIRKQRAQQQNQMMALQAAEQLSGAMKNAAPALEQMGAL